MQMAVAELGATRSDDAGDRRRAAGRALAGVDRTGIEVVLVEQRCHARPGDLQGGGHEHDLGRVPGGNVAAKEAVGQDFELRGAGRAEGGARRARGFGQKRLIDLGENARERRLPAGIARKGRGIERRLTGELGLGDLGGTRQRAGWKTGECRVLGRDDGCDQPQEAFQLMPVGELTQPLGAAAEDGGEIGQAHGIALGDVAQRVFAKGCRGTRGLVAAQGLPTS
jgi:hypothetical protein